MSGVGWVRGGIREGKEGGVGKWCRYDLLFSWRIGPVTKNCGESD